MRTRTRSDIATIGIAAIVLAFAASAVSAQTQSPALDLQLQQPVDDYDFGNGVDAGATVHGSFSSEVGYSKAYGNANAGSAELYISKQYGDGKSIDMHIDVSHSTGFAPGVRGYGPPYPGY